LISHFSKYRGIFAALVYTLLISFSRVYLGVHFFTDILGGWVLGSAIWLFYSYMTSHYTKLIESTSAYLLPLVHLVSFIGLLAVGVHEPYCLLAIGVGLGLPVLTRLNGEEMVPQTFSQRASILIWGLGGMLVIELGYGAFFSSGGDWASTAHFVVLGVWLSLAGGLWARLPGVVGGR
jgi:hypothetical protein